MAIVRSPGGRAEHIGSLQSRLSRARVNVMLWGMRSAFYAIECGRFFLDRVAAAARRLHLLGASVQTLEQPEV